MVQFASEFCAACYAWLLQEIGQFRCLNGYVAQIL